MEDQTSFDGIEDAESPYAQPATILLIEDRRLERDALTSALEGAMPGTRVDAVKDLSGAIEFLQRRPDTAVILIDGGLMLHDGVKALKLLARTSRRARIIVLSAHFEPDMRPALQESGAHGAFTSDIGVRDLVDRIRAIAAGGEAFELVETEDRKARLRKLFGLTDREYEIIEMIADGARNGEIAGWLNISESTVRVHVSKIVRKLGADTRMGAYDKWRKASATFRQGRLF